MGVLVYLNKKGLDARDECASNLLNAEFAILECIAELQQQKGIGSEFLIEKLNKKKEEISKMRSRVKNIPT